jgi:hypothetical protein
VVDATGGTKLIAALEILSEGFPHSFKPRLDET